MDTSYLRITQWLFSKYPKPLLMYLHGICKPIQLVGQTNLVVYDQRPPCKTFGTSRVYLSRRIMIIQILLMKKGPRKERMGEDGKGWKAKVMS